MYADTLCLVHVHVVWLLCVCLCTVFGSHVYTQVGVIDWVVNQMRDYPDNSSVQRQASILVRNMVSRTPEYRPEFLTRGVETLLRQAKRAHPKNCTDVGSAALRDLGCDNYNENWKVGGDLDKFLKAGN